MEKIKHIAIIMDGNGRYAKKLGEKRTFGHLQGTDNVRNIAIAANDEGVEVLTLYAFSTENWKRPQEEVSYLMKLPAVFIDKFLGELMEKNIRIQMIGQTDLLPADTLKVLNYAIEKTSINTGMILSFALNYGSRDELVCAMRTINDLGIESEQIDEEMITQHLMTKDYPEVDLMIRTSGECRISNFLLWQLAYSELMFVDVPWPLFTPYEFKACVTQFYQRDRRFGGLK
ncbi:MAG: isoprenyl transferase [Erysipelotrichaceae bacterium]